MNREQPYLSVVVTSRNDTHGGDPLARLQALVNSFSAQCLRFGLDAELIVVEWNPPPDRPRLRDVVRMPQPCGLVLRFVEVPPDLHATLPLGDVLPLFQMIGKNVGIRRARGQFVLSTNIDIIFSNELVEYLATRTLTPGTLYRVDRHDIEAAFPVDASLDAQMAYCGGHQLRLHAREGTYAVDRNGTPARLADDVVDGVRVAIGEGWHVREGDPACGRYYRWATDEAHLLIDRSGSEALAADVVLELELEPNPYEPDSWVEVDVLERDVLLARRRVARSADATRFCVALQDRVERHDVTVRLRAASPAGAASLPLFERRRSLAYRLFSARLRAIPLRAAQVHEYATRGPLQAHATGVHHFVVNADAADLAAFRLLDEPTGQPLRAETFEVYDCGSRLLMLSAELGRGDLVWLDVSDDATAAVRGSITYDRMRPTAGIGALAAWLRVVRMRLGRGFRRRQRAIRAELVPPLRRWLQRFDPAPPVATAPSPDDRSGTTAALSDIRDFLRANRPRVLHQNACGDFQLMAREHWFDLRGFAEFPTYSMSLDGLLSAAAEFAGVRERVLGMPICIYHLEHEHGSGWTPEGEALLRRRLADRRITWVDNTMVHVWTAYMGWLRRPMIFNRSDWGFASAGLPETTRQPVGDRV